MDIDGQSVWMLLKELRRSFSNVHVNLVKTIALIEIFRNGSGLVAEDQLLNCSVPNASITEIHDALNDLARASILILENI